MVSYIVRDRKILSSIIYPIFIKHPLLTRKYFSFKRIQKIHTILDSDLQKEIKDRLIFSIMQEKMPKFSISPA